MGWLGAYVEAHETVNAIHGIIPFNAPLCDEDREREQDLRL